MNGSDETGGLLIRLIFLCMDRLMHDPKRAVFVLLATVIGTLAAGEIIGKARELDRIAMPVIEATAVDRQPENFFDLHLIRDNGPVNLTPEPVPGS